MNNSRKVCINFALNCSIFGIDENYSIEKIYLFPNPTKNTVNILAESNATISEVSVFCSSGKQLLNTRPENGLLDVSMLQPGIYIIRVIIGNERFVEKLVIYK